MAEPDPFRQVRPPGRRDSIDADLSEERAFVSVLGEATGSLDDAQVDHVVMGGVAVAVLARPRWTHDVDLFVRPHEASRALGALRDAGYDTEKTDALWLFKAWKEDVLVDLIFRSQGGYYLDQSILDRSQVRDFKGVRFRVMPPEDLLVIKAAAHQEDAPYHWFDALALLASQPMDWDYLLERARRAVRRVLSLLVYAESIDIAVPPGVIESLLRYGHTATEGIGLRSEPERATAAEAMRQRLCEHPAVGELALDLSIDGSTLFIDGQVTTDERRMRISELARQLFPGWRVVNRVRLQQPGDPGIERL